MFHVVVANCHEAFAGCVRFCSGDPNDPDDVATPFDFTFFIFDVDRGHNGSEEVRIDRDDYTDCYLSGRADAPIIAGGDNQADSYNICTAVDGRDELRTLVTARQDLATNQTVFDATYVSGLRNNPLNPTQLDPEQKALSIGFHFQQKASFSLVYSVVAQRNRHFLFSGESNLLSTCPSMMPTSPDPTTVPTAAPSTPHPTLPPTWAPTLPPVSSTPITSVPTTAPSRAPTGAPSMLPSTSGPTAPPIPPPTPPPTPPPPIPLPLHR